MHFLDLASLTSFLLLIAMNGVVAAPMATPDASDVQLFQRAPGGDAKPPGALKKAKARVDKAVQNAKHSLRPFKCVYCDKSFTSRQEANGCLCIYMGQRRRGDD
ncbi:hypothetical protein C8J56DRAFT_1165423 [Mycena floridula]|nr:hypothetical protein C8J56DRAFT_1165423 [Mycena floridula]